MATNVSGRGVLRLIWMQQMINLLSIPMITMELIILAHPTTKFHILFCMSFEFIGVFTWANRHFSSLVIALGR